MHHGRHGPPVRWRAANFTAVRPIAHEHGRVRACRHGSARPVVPRDRASNLRFGPPVRWRAAHRRLTFNRHSNRCVSTIGYGSCRFGPPVRWRAANFTAVRPIPYEHGLVRACRHGSARAVVSRDRASNLRFGPPVRWRAAHRQFTFSMHSYRCRLSNTTAAYRLFKARRPGVPASVQQPILASRCGQEPNHSLKRNTKSGPIYSASL